jgi:hypothetical protein
MRHVVGNLPDLSHQFFNPVEHGVEVLCQLIPFVPCTAKRDPVAEPALHDFSSGSVHGFNPSDRVPRHEDTRDRGQNERQYGPVDQRRLDDPDESIEIVKAPADQQAPALQVAANYWYYCSSAKKYYPEAPSCAEPWIPVPPRNP